MQLKISTCSFYKAFGKLIKLFYKASHKAAICKPGHWNLGIGIGIGIGPDITNAIISSSTRPMDPKLAGWSLMMRGPHPQSHVTHQPSGHVTNRKWYISTFKIPVYPKFRRVLTHHE